MSAIYCDHNYLLVLLSYLVSVLGSYTALQLAIGIPAARSSNERWRALFGAGAAMGGGAIWAMHFIAMIACQMNLPVTYDLGLTALSALIGIASCTAGLAIASAGVFTWSRLALAGVFMGSGVAGMHYTGMAAMLMPAHIQYDMTIVAISVAIAIVASIAALWLAFNMRGWLQLLCSAMVMGVAVCGMHYTAMRAAGFIRIEETSTDFAHGLRGDSLGITIFAVASLLLLVVLGITTLRQRQRTELRI
jgi:NO-binding membrane sensor protein with MHYT domain